MNKRHLHHLWRYIRKVHPFYFLAIAIFFSVISLVSLRHNNEEMVRLRDAVYATDKSGGNTEAALRSLRSYVYGHMNTSLASGPSAVHPPIQLKYTYERLQAAQQAQLGQNNANVYNAAQQSCDSQAITGTALVTCIETYASDHGVALNTIPDALYKFDFTSAKWSPDLAGWSIVIAIFSFIAFIIGAMYRWWAKKYL